MNYNIEIKRGLTLQFNTLLSAYSVQWPNSNFTTPNDSTWLNFNILTGKVFQETLRDTDKINGIVQVDVMIPKLSGENDAYIIADILTSGLPKNNTAIVNGATNTFIETVSAPRVATDENWHKMIIETSFHAFVPRA